MRKIVAAVVCAVVGIAVGHGLAGPIRAGAWQQAQPEKQKPEEKLANHLKPTAESLALGKKFYGTDCEMCHGKEGAGDGNLAVELKLNLKNLRDLSVKDMSDDEMYKFIAKGKAPMLGREGRLNEQETWSVVNYVRSLGKTKS